MTIKELWNALGLTWLAGESDEVLEKKLEGCYIGDLLSWVMGRAGEDNIWLTVMGNVNSIAVAKLAEIGCVILCENAALDAEAKKQADANGVPVFGSDDPAYALALKVERLYAGTL